MFASFWLAMAMRLAATDCFIGHLVHNLGHSDYEVREASSKALLQIGSLALLYLTKAEKSNDLELAERSKRLITSIYDEYIPPNLKDVPSIYNLTLADYLRVGEKYKEQVRQTLKNEYGVTDGMFGRGRATDRLATRYYLLDKVRDGATRMEIQQLIKDMNHRPRLPEPIELHPDYKTANESLQRGDWK
jgi:hypothetical protein